MQHGVGQLLFFFLFFFSFFFLFFFNALDTVKCQCVLALSSVGCHSETSKDGIFTCLDDYLKSCNEQNNSHPNIGQRQLHRLALSEFVSANADTATHESELNRPTAPLSVHRNQKEDSVPGLGPYTELDVRVLTLLQLGLGASDR